MLLSSELIYLKGDGNRNDHIYGCLPVQTAA